MKNLILLGFLATIFTSCGFTNPETTAGHEGYVYESPRVIGKGGFLTTQKGPQSFGFSFYNNEVINVDMRVKTYDEGFNILCMDKINMAVSAQALISVKNGAVRSVVEDFGGKKWYQTKVMKVYRSYVRQAVQKFKSGEVKENRVKIKDEITKNLTTYLSDTPFVLEKLVIGNIDFPTSIVRAIETRVALEENEKAKDIENRIAEKDAAIRVTEARGIQQAQKIIDQSLTEITYSMKR